MLLLKSALVLLLLPAVLQAQIPNVTLDKSTLDLFAKYPDTNPLKMVFYSHAHREGLDKSDLVLFSTWFHDGHPDVVKKTTVNASGHVYQVTSVYDWAEQAARWQQLTERETQSVRDTLKTLPDSAQTPPLSFLLIVSFKLDGKWQTRLYDRRSSPVEVVKLYELVHSFLDIK